MDDASDDPTRSQGFEPAEDAMSRADWEQLPANPDLSDDLGYEPFDLEAYETDDGDVLVLPTDEHMLREDAFIIIGEDDLHTLEE